MWVALRVALFVSFVVVWATSSTSVEMRYAPSRLLPACNTRCHGPPSPQPFSVCLQPQDHPQLAIQACCTHCACTRTHTRTRARARTHTSPPHPHARRRAAAAPAPSAACQQSRGPSSCPSHNQRQALRPSRCTLGPRPDSTVQPAASTHTSCACATLGAAAAAVAAWEEGGHLTKGLPSLHCTPITGLEPTFTLGRQSKA